MEKLRRFEMQGTSLLFWVYAVLAWVGGFLLFGWGPVWLGVDFPGLPFLKASFVRMAGAAMMAAGCFAAAIAQVEDEEARRRAMLWFGVAHGILAFAAALQQSAIWASSTGDRAVTGLVTLTICFLAYREWEKGEVVPRTLQTLFGETSHAAPASVSRHEREIREAAGREERNRLARDLHDSIKQQLFAIQTAAATAQARFEPDPEGARGAIAQVRTAARDAMTEMEVLLDQLRAAPLENVGLVEALRRQCEAVGLRTGVKVNFALGELPPNTSLPAGAQQALFRVAQEALSNVARHARATVLNVSLGSVEGKLKLTVEDDGAGFDAGAASGGMGMRNMRERVAEFDGVFEIASAPGGGTRLGAAIPFTAVSTEAEYRRNARNEGVLLAVMAVIAIEGHSGALTGFAIVWSFRFLRSVALWRRARTAREVVG